MFGPQFERARSMLRLWCADPHTTIAEDLLTQRTLRKILTILSDLEAEVEDAHAEDSAGEDW